MFVDVYKDNKRKQEVYLIYVDLYSEVNQKNIAVWWMKPC